MLTATLSPFPSESLFSRNFPDLLHIEGNLDTGSHLCDLSMIHNVLVVLVGSFGIHCFNYPHTISSHQENSKLGQLDGF